MGFLMNADLMATPCGNIFLLGIRASVTRRTFDLSTSFARSSHILLNRIAFSAGRVLAKEMRASLKDRKTTRLQEAAPMIAIHHRIKWEHVDILNVGKTSLNF